MPLIRCDDCFAVHESTLPVCPGCGRCPHCGERRVSKRELTEQADCRSCRVPYCSGCGRCHHCGTLRFAEMSVCGCGFPADVEKVRAIERTFGLQTERKAGCLGILAVVGVALASLSSGVVLLCWFIIA